MVGSPTNGAKPYVYIQSGHEAIYLGSVLEAKRSTKSLAAVSSNSRTANFKEAASDIKGLIQPMLEVMAVAQVAEFPRADVPLVNIFGNKFVYRPLLYFRECDVLLTTPRPVHLRRDATTLDVLGLVLLFTLFQLHKRCVAFNMVKVETLPKSPNRCEVEIPPKVGASV